MQLHNSSHHSSRSAHGVDSSVGRALVAWVVMAILVIGFAALASAEASAAPLGAAVNTVTFDRGFAAILVVSAASLAFAVTYTMWRDLSRQTARTGRARDGAN